MKFVKKIIWETLQAQQSQKFSLTQLMEMSGLSRRSIISALKELIWEQKVEVVTFERPHSPGLKMNGYGVRKEDTK